MKLMTRKFECIPSEWSGDYWWECEDKEYGYLGLCYDTLDDFVKISEKITTIEITISTNRLSKHSLELIQSQCEWEWNTILCDDEQIQVTPAISCLLNDLFKKYKKIFVTIYYTE